MRTLRLILGDHLSADIASLRDVAATRDIVLMVEVAGEATHVPHHKQKLVLIFSAMRHFAEELRLQGVKVDYVRLDSAENSGSFVGELDRAVNRHMPDRLVACEPSEWRVRRSLEQWRGPAGNRLELLEDDRFFASRARFARWAGERKVFRMEHFYREMRRESGVLMDGGQPVGGQWNFDADNRKPWPGGSLPPQRRRFATDAITQEAVALVEARFCDHFGDASDFDWPVTRSEALEALDHFVEIALPRFGDHQDAMRAGQPWLCHSLIAPAMNLGLLSPREVCSRAEAAFRDGRAPLNAVEGFIRQILGWREYVRGIYWHFMPSYAESNVLDARRPLPAFFWGAPTRMRCVSEVIEQTRRHAYAHHIQRLMVTGNFALLAGLRPAEVEAWYLAVYADAFEWVELPNTHGMALYADGGRLGSKPYAASGAYIDRMSDYCKDCSYDVREKSGPQACPFNYLYWAFLIRNRTTLERNPRMAMPYRTLAGWDEARLSATLRMAESFLDESCAPEAPTLNRSESSPRRAAVRSTDAAPPPVRQRRGTPRSSR